MPEPIYTMRFLDIAQLNPNPVAQFDAWFQAWQATQPAEPSAMVLATTDDSGMPWARTVLLKQYDEHGFVFFTNRDSHKGRQLDHSPGAALHFLWLPAPAQTTPDTINRQVLVQGRVVRTSVAEDDAYFISRPRDSQLGAWASQQSQTLLSRAALEDRFASYTQRYSGSDIPRPPHWGGYRVVPQRIEFWQAGHARLHDRFAYLREGAHWTITRLNP